MNGICPICGCKTAELDFSEVTLGAEEIKTCSFCAKQLHSLSASDASEDNAVQLRWLDAVLSKEVPSREKTTDGELRTLRAKFPIEPFVPVGAPVAGRTGAGLRAPAGFQAQAPSAAPGMMPQNQAIPGAFGTAGAQNPAQAQQTVNPAASAAVAKGEVSLASLDARLRILEGAFLRYKRSMLIKSILEIILPVILMLILLIIFLNSGIYDQLKYIIRMAGIAIRPQIPGIYQMFML